MIQIQHDNAGDYLRGTGRVGVTVLLEIRELPGGVSNAVFLVTLPTSGERFVLKQARERLRVQEEWLCPVERIWREVEVLRICGELLEARSGDEAECQALAPRVLWEDRGNYLYAMTAAPAGQRTWKEMLLAGETNASEPVAVACGRLLARLHAGSWNSAAIAARLDDREYFDQLRLDPYYRHVARVHPELAPNIERLIGSVWQNRRCLVHGDFSPKNLLVWPGNVMLIDFEVGHYGDPAFDLGFFLTHLVLKSVWAGPRHGEYLNLATSFWNTYLEVFMTAIDPAELVALEQRMLWNLAGCLLARIDGKSPVDYLSLQQQDEVRQVARQWLQTPPLSLQAAINLLRQEICR